MKIEDQDPTLMRAYSDHGKAYDYTMRKNESTDKSSALSAFMATEGYLVMAPIRRSYGRGQVTANTLNSWESILGNKTWSSNLKPDQAGRGSRTTCREGRKKKVIQA